MCRKAVTNPGTYFLANPHHTICCTPLANIKTRKKACKYGLAGKLSMRSTATQNEVKASSNAKNNLNGILNKYQLL